MTIFCVCSLIVRHKVKDWSLYYDEVKNAVKNLVAEKYQGSLELPVVSVWQYPQYFIISIVWNLNIINSTLYTWVTQVGISQMFNFFVHIVVNYKVYSYQFCNKNKSIITNRWMFVQK